MRIAYRLPVRYLSAIVERPGAGSRVAAARTERSSLSTRVRPFAALCARVAMLVVLFVLVEKGVRAAGYLPEAHYFQRFIFVELGERMIRSAGGWLLLLPAGLIAGALFTRVPAFRRGLARLWHPWSELEHGPALRVFVGVVAFVAAWAFSTYDYNLYFDQSHYADRLLLLALAGLLCWRPVFVYPFLLLLVTVVAQFNHPMHAYPWTEINLLIRVLALFGAAFLLYGLSGRRKTDVFVFVLCCLIATNYWWSGLGKLERNWIMHPHLNLLMLGAYANGWLTFLEPATITWLSEKMAGLNLPLMGFTLLVEGGSLFILWRRATLLGFLGAFMAFHLGIFAVSGMFFWKWIVVEAALLALLLSNRRIERLPIFTRRHFVLSLLLIGGCTLWVHPTNLTWYDTPLTYTYRLEGIGASGAAYRLPTRTFTPYADIFQLGIFGYLNPYPQLTGIWGIVPSNHALADAVLRLSTLDEVEALERAHPRVRYDSAASVRFDAFIERFIGNLNRRRSRRTWLSAVQAPPHLWSFPLDGVFQVQEPLTKVVVYQVTSLYDGKRFADIRKRAVREIDVPAQSQ